MDPKKNKDLIKLVAFMRKNGVTRYKSGDLEIDLAISSLFPESEYKKKKALIENDSPAVDSPTFTEEQILNWSSTPAGSEEVN